MNISDSLWQFDTDVRIKYGETIIGIDEVGRGAISGPITAAAVCLPKDWCPDGLTDSKKLAPKKREQLAAQIKENALAYSIESIEPALIDKNGLTWANQQVMLLAAQNVAYVLDNAVSMYLIDQSPHFALNPHIMMSKGDSTSLSIAAASVIAKVYRDNLMEELSVQYPNYGLDKSKGYITAIHKDAIKKYGLVQNLHRFSYDLK